MLEREMQERGMNSSTAGQGEVASSSENHLAAANPPLPPPPTIGASFASRLQEKSREQNGNL